MNKSYKFFLILVIGILFASCNKSDSSSIDPPRDYATQRDADMVTIEDYFDEYYMEVSPDLDVTFTKIPEGGTQQSIREQTEHPLLFKMVTKNDIEYKVYYLNLREAGNFGANETPTAVDSVYVSYKGKYLYYKSDEVLPATDPKTYVENLYDAQFDYAQNPIWFQLEGVVSGWAEIIPLFKTGFYDDSSGPNPTVFTDFGAGVMFLPSGLGYYNSSAGSIPVYSPLVFSFKLNNLRFKDHDRDGILSKYEVDPAVANQKPIDYDSDGDGTPNFFDTDDDDDHYLTKNEIRRPNIIVNGVSVSNGYYPFNGAAVDDPLTPNIDERQGIPRAFTGPLQNPSLPESSTNHKTPQASDFTDPLRLRRHLDPTSFPPFE